VLQKEFAKVEGVVRAKRRPYIPVALSRPEVDRIIGLLEPPYNLIVKLLYGCGLRLFECLKLRVQDLNFDMQVLTVHDGKGLKDRTLPMPATLTADLWAQIQQVANLHEQDLATNYAGVFLPSALDVKYKNASKEFAWQWLFPAKSLSLVSGSKEYRRYHLHETHVQQAIKLAVRRSRIAKRASAHTFRHSYASPSIASQRRYSHHPGIVGPQRFENNNDLHAYRAQSDDQRSEKSSGFLITPQSLTAISQFAVSDRCPFYGCNWP
jgi:integrase